LPSFFLCASGLKEKSGQTIINRLCSKGNPPLVRFPSAKPLAWHSPFGGA
jgi:hypothetical protein